jgi:hypothetical protein
VTRASSAAIGIAALMAAHASGVAEAKGPQKRNVRLFVEGVGCSHEVDAKPAKLEKKKTDAIGLRIENGCNIQRKALVCVYDAAGKRATPFGACTSVPPGLALATPFTLAASGGKAEIDCPAEHEGSYTAVVYIGDEVRPAGCPATPPKEKMKATGEETFNHRFAIDILP